MHKFKLAKSFAHVYSFRLLGLSATITYKMRERATFEICLRYIFWEFRGLDFHVVCDFELVTSSVYEYCDVTQADAVPTLVIPTLKLASEVCFQRLLGYIHTFTFG